MDLHRRNIKEDTINTIKPYQKQIHNMYWNYGMSFKEISELLDIASPSSIYRYMALFDKVRTKAEQLDDLRILNTGRVWSEECKNNVSVGVKRSYENEELHKRRSNDNKRIWANMTAEEKEKRFSNGLKSIYGKHIGKSMSSIEEKVKNQLDENKIRYIQQKSVYDIQNKKVYYLDFYIPEYKLVIECNGDYWHSKPKRIKRDKMLEKFVKYTGRKIIFIWEHEIKDEWFDVMDYIKEVI